MALNEEAANNTVNRGSSAAGAAAREAREPAIFSA